MNTVIPHLFLKLIACLFPTCLYATALGSRYDTDWLPPVSHLPGCYLTDCSTIMTLLLFERVGLSYFGI